MMPGETHSAAPGTAADLSRCQGCASLQQNLNEYVDALITLKQKIINTDNLLTEYQKKCDVYVLMERIQRSRGQQMASLYCDVGLQFARRENSTLHHQVEQMLQKISPLQKCQEELGSLKAELEEKKSSLKLYQDTHQEYARVKEECLKTDAQKKKLEAKVKKLEEAAVKQTQDFKQLRNEKKILEKEFKKTQERLDEFSKQKNEKELRHIGTQISNDSYGSIDKRKVKLLLKELWLCVNTTHRLPGEGSRCVPEKPAIETSRSRELGEDGAAPAAGVSPLRASSVQACLAELSMEIEGDFSTCKDTGREGPGGAAPWDDGAFAVDWDPAASGQRNGDDSTDFLDHDPCFDEDLQAAVDFFRLPPPLLSPVPSPPPVTSPHLGPLPPSLAPETYFGECTDSSDNEMNEVQQRNAESASEGDTLEPQDGFSSPGKRKGSGVRGEELKAQEASQALGALDISRVSTAGFGTFTATLREPSAALSFAREKYWALSSELLSDRENGILEEAGRWGAVRGVDGVVRTENPRPEPPGSPACGEGLALGTSDSCPSHLGPQPLHEPNASEGKTLGSRVTGSPSSELTEGVLADAVASESGCLSLSGPFQGLPADLEKERAGTPGLTSGKPPVRGAVAAAVRAAGLSLEDQLSSCSASAASSLCGHPLSPPGMEDDEDTRIPAEGGPSQLLHSQQKVQATTFDVLAVRSESPHRPIGDSHLEGSSRVLSPGVGACGSSGQRSSEPGCRTLVKASSDGHSTLQPGAPGAAGDRPAERQVPSGSGLASSAGPQPGLVRSGLGFASSTWWHHSNLLQRGGEGGPGARAGPVLETGRQSHEATPCAESTGPASKPERAGEGAGPGGFRAPVSLLPNQVSVITKQARPAATQSARWGPPRPAGREAPLAAYVASGPGAASGAASGAGCGEGGHRAQKAGEPAAPPGMGPGAPTSWRRLDFDSPSASSPVENSHCPTNSKLSVSSKNIPVPKQDMVTEAAVQEETHAASPCLQAADLDLPALGVHTRPAPEATLSRGFPAKETPCGDAVRSAGEALAVSEDLPVLPRGPNPPLQLPSPTPGSASPEGLGTAGTAPSPALGGADAEKRADPQSSLSAALYCYSGVREAGAGDSEGEESEAPSCSEAESEPDAALESGPRRAGRGASGEDPGAAGGGAAPRRPPVEVGHLTSALRDCSIGAPSDADRLSTSEVVTFLESCQLRDYSSGDSVSECSSKGTRNRGMDTEVKESEPSGEKYREQLCEEDALDSSEEWAESEEEDRPLRSRSALSEVLAGTGQEPQTEQEAAGGKDADDALFLNVHDSVTAERMEERVPPPEATSSESPCSNAPLPMAGSDTGGGSDHENTGSSSEAHLDVIKPVAGGEEAPTELLCPDSGAGPGEMTFQCQISTVTSEVINVLINKDQNLVIEKGENWTIINGVALVPSVDQVILCDASADAPASPEPEGLGAGFMSVPSVEKSPESGAAFQEPQGDSQVTGAQEDAASGGQSANFDKSRLRNRPVKPSVRISSEIYDQNFESQTVPSDHTYYNSKLEPFGKNKNRSKIANRDQSNKPVKTAASGKVEATPREASPSFPGERGTPRAPRNPTQTILASADTSTPADCSADTLSKIRQEVGPPLPPLLAPLIATPPRTSLPSSPLVSSSSPSSPISPLGGVSPLCDLPVPPMMSPLPEEPGHPSPCPSPPAAPASERVLSSPLQFCAATPKHALPVPGRLPRLAPAQPSVAAPQENSVKILDTMYPELSARARTLSILKGNLQLARAPPAAAAAASAGKTRPGPVCAATGFKAITSASTAFVKAGGSAAGDGTQDKARELGTRPDSAGKRTLAACPPRGAKRLRLDSGSPEPAPPAEGLGRSLRRNDPQAEAARTEEEDSSLPAASTAPQMPPSPEETVESQDRAIADALKKIAEASFDLLPVIRSHVYVGNISKKPVMRDQEKEVVYEFSTTKKHLAECLLHSILSELKLQKASVERSYGHALCRVYVGVCRQLGDLERARLFCYSLLKEDFPESEKLTLFIANMWHDVFMSQSVVSKAMQLVARQRATGEVLNCLRAFLSWEKNAPLDVGFMVSKLLLTIQLCPNTEFQSSEKSGEDLSDSTWEYISAIDLLCCHQRWVWTHDHIISKELWPVMDKWIKYRKGRANVAHTPDIIVASVLRLIGRLGQLGLKEGFPSAVKNISAVIGMFIQHARDEDIPWGIQLAAVYALCDLSPSNPEEIAKILEAWRQEASRSVPTAVLGYLEEVNALCAEGRS